MTNEQKALYDAAKAADDAFSAECVRQFGANAGTYRYLPYYYDATTREAAATFHRAMDEWSAVSRKLCGII